MRGSTHVRRLNLLGHGRRCSILLSGPALAFLACVPSLEIPPGTEILCSSEDDCPPGWSCLVRPGQSGVCQTPGSSCGNSVADIGEGCDDGNDNNDDACLNDCTPNRCGDGFRGPDEACDDGEGNSDLWSFAGQCDRGCTGPSPFCGDGTADTPPEACDDGNDVDDDDCRNDCSLPSCGDGFWSAQATGALAEACDDGDDIDTNNCTNACRMPICGDAVVWEGSSEECDDGGNPTGTCSYGVTACTVCDTSCKWTAGATSYCGDGAIDAAHETCDDGDAIDTGNGCDAICQRNDECGDGIVQRLYEECDDFNSVTGDGCAPNCRLEPFFGCSQSTGVCFPVVFVRPDGAGDGFSWAQAKPTLQDGLGTAATKTMTMGEVEIWLATATYTPDAGANVVASDRNETFTMVDQVRILGGFAGDEGLREQRDWVANPTILSGDLIGDDDSFFSYASDNAFHVVTSTGNDDTAVLDGVIIEGGYAAPGVAATANGGGLLLSGSSMQVRNTIIRRNYAFDGGGVYLIPGAGTPVFVDVDLVDNHAVSWGGGLYAFVVSVELTRVRVARNVANTAGGVLMYGSTLTLTDCTFDANFASAIAGGVWARGGTTSIAGGFFASNTAGYAGGGIAAHSANLSLTGVTIRDNRAPTGAGLFVEMALSLSVQDSTFERNIASNGGAVWLSNSPQADFDAVNFSGNEGIGGALYIDNSMPTVTRSRFDANLSITQGGAANHKTSIATYESCIFTDNWAQYNGGAMSSDGSTVTVVNGVFVGSFVADTSIGTGSVADGDGHAFVNSIIWNNGTNGGLFDEMPSVSYSCVQEVVAGTGNVSVDPEFISAQDLQLDPGSPLIDQGDNASVTLSTDFAGQPRITDGDANPGAVVDMGAYELQP